MERCRPCRGLVLECAGVCRKRPRGAIYPHDSPAPLVANGALAAAQVSRVPGALNTPPGVEAATCRCRTR